jgi:hypothetical protein
MQTITKEPSSGSHSTFQYGSVDLSPNGTLSPNTTYNNDLIVQPPGQLHFILERLHNIVGYNRELVYKTREKLNGIMHFPEVEQKDNTEKCITTNQGSAVILEFNILLQELVTLNDVAENNLTQLNRIV